MKCKLEMNLTGPTLHGTVKINGQEVPCRNFAMEGGVNEVTTITLELLPTEVDITIDEAEAVDGRPKCKVCAEPIEYDMERATWFHADDWADHEVVTPL